MSMNLKPAFRYTLKNNLKAAAVFLLVIALVIAGICVIASANGGSGSSSFSGFAMAGAIFTLVLGIAGIREDLRMLIQNGISRRTAFANAIIMMAAVSLATAAAGELITGLGQLAAASRGNLSILDVYQMLYIGQDAGVILSFGQHVMSLLFNAALMLMMGVWGSFFSLLFWRLGKFWTVVVAISIPVLCNVVPWLLYKLGTAIPTAGRFGSALFRLLAASPWNCIALFLLLAAVACVIDGLLLRRVNIRAPASK